MDLISKKRLTIVAEQALEGNIRATIKQKGANSFTILDCMTESSEGPRAGDWDQNKNLTIHVICDHDTMVNIMQEIEEKYCEDYFIVMFTSDIAVHPASNL